MGTRFSILSCRTSISLFLIAAIAAMVCVSCAGSSLGADRLVTYQQNGGFAGLDIELIIYHDGSAILKQQDVTTKLSLEPSEINQIDRLFQEADFLNLESEYLSENMCCDLIDYRLTYQAKTVRTVDGAIPDALVPLIERLNELIAQHSRA